MKKPMCVVALCLTLVAGCGSSAGESQSYKLGQYDGAHRLKLSAQNAAPGTIKGVCVGQLAVYSRSVASYTQDAAKPVNKRFRKQLKKIYDRASTPDFTMDLTGLADGDYLKGCESALKKKLSG